MSKVTLNDNSLKIWTDQRLEHLRYEYDLTPDSLVIDLGAYYGEFSKEIYARYKCRIIAVEPSEYIRDFKDGEVIEKAAGVHNGKLQFGGRAYYASIFEATDHEYDCFDINDLLNKYLKVALLKVNIEGAEYDVLNHIIDHNYHKRIKNIQVQFHQIEGVPYELWYKEIVKKLELTHEKQWGYDFVWESWRVKDRSLPGDGETAKILTDDFLKTEDDYFFKSL